MPQSAAHPSGHASCMQIIRQNFAMLPMGVSIHTVYFQVSFNNSDLMSERVKTPNRGTVGIVSSCHTWRLGQMFRWMGCVGMGQGQASRVCEWRMFGAQAVYWWGVVSLQKLLIDVPGVTAGVWFPFREFLVNKASAPPRNRGNKQPCKMDHSAQITQPYSTTATNASCSHFPPCIRGQTTCPPSLIRAAASPPPSWQ